jgi:superfamily II DNA or RNA helicase/predicted house-cleaning noncanonical NTP pyrophosphatase (MazG superfamily)/HKD family nuclease
MFGQLSLTNSVAILQLLLHLLNCMRPIFYRKLIRDRIPEIIKQSGKTPQIRTLSEPEYRDVVGAKILEEAHELFAEWQQNNPDGVLKESADMIEILVAALQVHGLTLDDLLTMRQKRADERGGFLDRLFLESVDGADTSVPSMQTQPAIVFNPAEQRKLIQIIRGELAQSDSAWIASAFYSPGITNLLISDIEQFLQNSGSLHILLSTMGNVVHPDHLSHLKSMLPETCLKVFHPSDTPFDQNPQPFHVKAFLFHRRSGNGSMLIGSSNFTEAGFMRNIEWNYFTQGEINLAFDNRSAFEQAVTEFGRIWDNLAVAVTPEFISGYRRRFAVTGQETRTTRVTGSGLFETPSSYGKPIQQPIIPNAAQIPVLKTLARQRKQGIRKSAVVAATGIGKTFLAALDFQQSGASRILFIAHRETILTTARQSFAQVMQNPDFGVILGGSNGVPQTGDAVFAMIQTISRPNHLERFVPDHFDYIVVDEFHHSEAASYRRILAHFTPKFLLGLTATPERMDGRDVLAICDYNMACDIRLMDAVDRSWLTPFQYYAIYDQTDYSQIAWRGTRYDEVELSRALETDTRTQIIARNLKKYLPSFGKIKALAFCSSVAHARFTAEQLTQKHGLSSLALTGDTPEIERRQAIFSIQSETDPLNVICCVDIFNEGIDIPSLTHVLLVRPTLSFTVFLQQLGRGLRLAPQKEFLVVLDFVGNFRKAHVAPLALAGFTSIDQFVEYRKSFGNGDIWASLPATCFVHADTDVQRVWDDEIRRIITGIPEDEQLKMLYQEIREDLDNESPGLMDFLDNPRDMDPYRFIRQFGSWLKTKQFCEGDLPNSEKRLLNTPGEAFLSWLESDLNPVKSYKMVVLLTLLDMPGTEWQIVDIAKGFLQYFLDHPDRMSDYDDLAKSLSPEAFSIKKVISKLKQMPLNFLSNTEKDFFILDKKVDMFRLKPEMIDFWKDEGYRQLIRDRVMFAAERYFRRQNLTLHSSK